MLVLKPHRLGMSPAYQGLQFMQFSEQSVGLSISTSDHPHYFSLGCWELLPAAVAYHCSTPLPPIPFGLASWVDNRMWTKDFGSSQLLSRLQHQWHLSLPGVWDWTCRRLMQYDMKNSHTGNSNTRATRKQESVLTANIIIAYTAAPREAGVLMVIMGMDFWLRT